MFYRVSPTCQSPQVTELYSKYLGEKTNGVFVEVGANDGEYVSNTCGLADMGWTGYYIEPLPDVAQQCRMRHGKNKVTVDTVAIGKEKGRLQIYKAPGLTAVSTSLPEMRDVWKQYFNGEVVDCQMVTLDYYLNLRNVPIGFDLLIVDTEGTEWDVLQASNIEHWKPKMIIAELHENDNPCYEHLESLKDMQKNIHGYLDNLYTVVYSDQVNTVFVLKELT